MPDDERLSPEDIAILRGAVEKVVRRRRIELLGVLATLVVLVVGTIAALAAYGLAPRERFMVWVFLVPPGVAGMILWGFGRWARLSGRVGPAAAPSPSGTATPPPRAP